MEGDGGKGVDEGVGMRRSVFSISFQGTGSCDGEGVGALREGDSFFSLAFFLLARASMEVVFCCSPLRKILAFLFPPLLFVTP